MSRLFVWPPWRYRHEYEWGPIEHILGNAYVLAAFALCVWGTVTLFRHSGAMARPLASGVVPRPRKDDDKVKLG